MAAQEWHNIEAVTPKHLMIGRYKRVEITKVDITDLIVVEECLGQKNPVNVIYPQPQDFKVLMLQSGCAEVREYSKAPESYKTAQDLAMAKRAGLWLERLGPLPQRAELRTPPSISTEQAGANPIGSFNAAPLLAWIRGNWEVLTPVLAVFGLGTFLGNLLLRRFNTRNPRLLLLGEPSAGKTALSYRLHHPKATEKEVFAIGPSSVRAQSRPTEPIQIGPLSVHPLLIDMPGTAYGEILDALVKRSWFGLRRPCNVLFVLAPTGDKVAATLPNPEYLQIQYGVIRAQLEAVLSSKAIQKPRSVILFINKFDLLSDLPPEDPKASIACAQITQYFQRHINSIETAAGKTHTVVVIGSAARNWGTHEVKEAIAHSYRSRA